MRKGDNLEYNFFYDETEHSRSINLKTITSKNYYDNFSTAIVGWAKDNEDIIYERYANFETKYEYRKTKGELKSTTMKSKDLELGFASLNGHKIDFYEDLLSMYDEKTITYISVFSKIEFVINQIFKNYRNTMFVDVDLMKYSIIKALLVYRPSKVYKAIYENPEDLMEELKSFFEERIDKNKENITLKRAENRSFEQILILLDEVEPISKIEWEYYQAFEGFGKLLNEMGIDQYSLRIDKEGDFHKTADAAISVGLSNVSEEKSDDYIGIRMADMLIGLVSRMMHSLNSTLTNDYVGGKIQKTLLPSGWFCLNERQLNLYKQFYKIICVDNKYWYNTYSGIFSDDLVAFISLLQFMDHFDNAEEIRKSNIEKQPEYYNGFVLSALQQRYVRMQNKLKIDPIILNKKDHFYNQKNAVVYKEPNMHQDLPLMKGENRYLVLAVGIHMTGIPLVTIAQDEEAICYKLPLEYTDWAMTVVGMASMGEDLFPSEVVFTKQDNRYLVDIL
ncbi:MAG: hypothetical protein PUJ55_11640 [Clostridiales bacterium]|nr:hypothetical protein [Roseburia sp.]MDD7637575.1 hypothetical protein [Clostridiales bacterium]MDY4112194.1 hypothetical protein [Roseburia sp.]